ncbi:MAG: hypothetical protein ABI763_00445 [Bacteroidota bacterium]
MPEKYLKSLLNNKENLLKNNKELLKPITAILIENKKIYVWNWGVGEYLFTKSTISKLRNELELNYVPLNFNYNNSEGFEKYKYSLINKENKMVLLVRKPDEIDSIQFDKFIFDTIPIVNANSILEQVKLIGRFNLFDKHDSLTETGLNILANGKTTSSKFLSSLRLNGGRFVLQEKQINGVILMDSISPPISGKFFPQLGLCMYAKVKLKSRRLTNDCLLRFKDDDIFIYEVILSSKGIVQLKCLLFRLHRDYRI